MRWPRCLSGRKVWRIPFDSPPPLQCAPFLFHTRSQKMHYLKKLSRLFSIFGKVLLLTLHRRLGQCTVLHFVRKNIRLFMSIVIINFYVYRVWGGGGEEDGEDYRQIMRGIKWARKFSEEYMQFLDWLFAKCCLARDGVHWLLQHIAWIGERGQEELWSVTLLETFCHLPVHRSCIQVPGVLLGRLIDGFRLHCKCTFFWSFVSRKVVYLNFNRQRSALDSEFSDFARSA